LHGVVALFFLRSFLVSLFYSNVFTSQSPRISQKARGVEKGVAFGVEWCEIGFVSSD
jgi:hypothetical protein